MNTLSSGSGNFRLDGKAAILTGVGSGIEQVIPLHGGFVNLRG